MCDECEVLRQRVREAEAARQEWADLWQKASMSVLRLTDERDAARGKLDKVRALCEQYPGLLAGRRVLAILDDKETT